MENTSSRKIRKQVRPCIKCSGEESTVIKVYPETFEIVGWYCPTCKLFKKEDENKEVS